MTRPLYFINKQHRGIKSGPGFTVIEVLMTLVLVGIITATAGMFLLSGVTGYLNSINNAEISLKTQIALERMSSEFKNIRRIPFYSSDTITYDNELSTNRTFFYDTNTSTIRLNAHILIDDIESCTLQVLQEDLNGDGSTEDAGVRVTFKHIGNPHQFVISVYPRNLL